MIHFIVKIMYLNNKLMISRYNQIILSNKIELVF